MILNMSIIAIVSVMVVVYVIKKSTHASNSDLKEVSNEIKQEVGKLKQTTEELRKIKESELKQFNDDFDINNSRRNP